MYKRQGVHKVTFAALREAGIANPAEVRLFGRGGAMLSEVLEDNSCCLLYTSPLTEDGLKIDFDDSWVQIRPSNTEPIVRVYTEAPTEEGASAVSYTHLDVYKRQGETCDRGDTFGQQDRLIVSPLQCTVRR